MEQSLGARAMSESRFDTKVIAEVSIIVALSLVLNFIKIFQMPQGGSITLGSMVPVLLLSFRRGSKVGVFAGVIFGFAQMMLDGWFYSPVGMFLDYPLVFGALGLAGIFKKTPPSRRRHLPGGEVSLALLVRCRLFRDVRARGHEPRGLLCCLQRELHASGARDKRDTDLHADTEKRA